MDLSELSHIARMSANAEMFNGFLFQRCVQVKMKGTAYGRVRPAALGELTLIRSTPRTHGNHGQRDTRSNLPRHGCVCGEAMSRPPSCR